MRAILVDDEPIMLKRFVRLSAAIPDINIVGQFETAAEALAFVRKNTVELAFLDVEMPIMNGIDLAKQLRELRHDILIVFVSAYNDYIWDSNQIGGDYYIMKPYSQETLELAMERIRLIARRQEKKLYVQTFGRFLVLQEGKPIPLTGKAKEILALIITKRGKEVSNETIYSTIWEGREYSNANMGVYYNALRRLKTVLQKANCIELLVSTRRGQRVNTELFDCDYYAWQDKRKDSENSFRGDFLSEYTWAEEILAIIMRKETE